MARRSSQTFLERHPVLGWFCGYGFDTERTDRGFWEDGTIALTRNKKASRWSYMARWKHMLWHSGGVAVPILWLAGFVWPPGRVLAYALVLIAVEQCVMVVWRDIRQRRHEKQWLRPLHMAIWQLVGQPRAASPGSYLEVPRNFATAKDAQIRIGVNREMSLQDETLDKIGVATARVLGLNPEDLTPTPQLEGTDPCLMYRIEPPPPPKVPWLSILDQLPVTESQILLGLGRGGNPVIIDLDSDEPHILVSSSTGGGKSTLLRSIAAQLAHKGCLVIILDPKRHSHRWAKGLPNVICFREPRQMYDAVWALSDELDRRDRIVEASAWDAAMPKTGRRVVILAEECNMLREQQDDLWELIKPPGAKKTPDMYRAMAALLHMGRAVQMHIVAVAQQGTARIFGGGDRRENFGFRILLKAWPQTWRMLVPHLKASEIPARPKRRGRGHLVVGSSPSLLQFVDVTEEQARLWAAEGQEAALADLRALQLGRRHDPILTGLETPVTPETQLTPPDQYPGISGGSNPGNPMAVGGWGPTRLGPQLRLVRPEQGVQDLSEHIVDTGVAVAELVEPAVGVTLTEACAAGLLTISREAAKSARKQDPEFPKSIGHRGQALIYDPETLRRWQVNRERERN